MKFKIKLLTIVTLTIIAISCNKKNCDGMLYGIPLSNTGLDNSRCKPVCECDGKTSKTFTAEEISLMQAYTNTNPIAEITTNPYNLPVIAKPASVCAVIIDDKINKKYHLETFSSQAEAEKVGAIVTHIDACGACSTLQDLTVYAENLDVGGEVRKCAIWNLNNPLDSLIVCIENIGFTLPCAQIWAYNTKNTQAECFDVCISNNTYNNPDGTLSECLQCDEDKSGPVFKAVAGRTRRNTGIANAICRFCEEVQIVDHNYPLK